MPSTECHPTWQEEDRLAALASYKILDTSPEKVFEDVVRLTSLMLDAPIVAINFIAEGRQWFKSELGLGVREMPLDDSICRLAILQQDRMVVPDTRNDSRFDRNALVTGEPGLRFYAGELLKTADGFPLGTLCVLDTKPRPDGLTEQQEFALKTLAQQVLAQLELRKLIHEQKLVLAEKEALLSEKQAAIAENELVEKKLLYAQERSRIATEAAELGLWSWDPVADQVVWENPRPYEILGIPRSDAPVNAARFLKEFVHPDDAPGFKEAIASALNKQERLYFQGRIFRPTGEMRWMRVTADVEARAGRATDLYGMKQDITAEMPAQDPLP